MTGSVFNPRVVLGLVLFGAAAFFATLWFIGSGQTSSGSNNGASHAASRGLTGYAALADLLEAQGREVRLSRSRGSADDMALLVLTPPQRADGEEIAEILQSRRYVGPTLLILPKWNGIAVPQTVSRGRKGWVALAGASGPQWVDEIKGELALEAEIGPLLAPGSDWRGLGLSGALPDRTKVQGLTGGTRVGLAWDSTGRDLVAYFDDGGCYPVLDAEAGVDTRLPEDCDSDRWNVTAVAEPDLFNNYGMADRERALLASRVVEAAMEGEDLPVIFDLTLNGLGGTRNLLSLAFAPPFLAATLCLAIALLVVGWRAFNRFGPPLAETRPIAFGKHRLVANSAGFIRRARRLHLLAEPYAALVGRRLAKALGLKHSDEAAIDAALARRAPDAPSFSHQATVLREARGPADILRAANALRSIERTVSR